MKERLDIVLVQRNLAPSRAKAKVMIQSDVVYVDGVQERKAGTMVEDNCDIRIQGELLPYVSRGGLKLEKALRCFQISLNEKVCMDVGASTGGFTDCMLQNGARKVFAVDVGQNQLDETLRQNARVISMEKTNIRYLEPEKVGEEMEFISVDVSFISLTKILLSVYHLLEPQGQAVCLIKPQFEAGKENVGKKGVVKNKAIHKQVIEQVSRYAEEIGFSILNLDYSPIKGPEGNIEYLLHLKKTDKEEKSPMINIAKVVEESHGMLDHKEKK